MHRLEIESIVFEAECASSGHQENTVVLYVEDRSTNIILMTDSYLLDRESSLGQLYDPKPKAAGVLLGCQHCYILTVIDSCSSSQHEFQPQAIGEVANLVYRLVGSIIVAEDAGPCSRVVGGPSAWTFNIGPERQEH